MARLNPVFLCSACGGESLKWQGQCPACGEWNTLEQRLPAPGRPGTRSSIRSSDSGAPQRLGSLGADNVQRLASRHEELDRVMGGGIVPGSVSLLGGDP